MSNALTIIRSLVIYSLCLPLAIMLGYLLAMPMDAMSFTIVVAALFLPLMPVLLKYHHLLLIACWNTTAVLFFLPGRPTLCLVMTGVSFLVSIVQHILNRNIRFLSVPSVTRPLIFLALVIVVTAQVTGGLGARLLGGDSYGARRYALLLAAIIGYFALSSFRVPPGKATLFVALYLLGAITSVVGNLAPYVNPSFYFIFSLFPVESLAFMSGGPGEELALRMGGLTFAGAAMAYYILARHGVRELFNFQDTWSLSPIRIRGGLGFNNPWRFFIFIGLIWISLLGGYRSVAIILAGTFLLQFYLEGLFRTQLLPALLMIGILLGALSLPMVNRLPITIQRSLSFLPLDIDPIARYAADSTTEWRLRIWQQMLPMVPQYFFLGKGYAINPGELNLLQDAAERGSGDSSEAAIVTGDYHSGPLSLIIPLGIFGVIGFLWFLSAGFKVLINNFRHGDPELRLINTFLLAYFTVRVLFYFVIFGAFYGEFCIFTGLIGLSVSLNGGVRRAVPVLEEKPAFEPFKFARVAR
jgi:O-Antigen ligase